MNNTTAESKVLKEAHAAITHPRERLIRTAATLVHRQGWTITGINQILTEAGIPKGSFYYYFRSKEALGVAVLQHHHTVLKTMMERSLLNESLEVDAALDAFLTEVCSGELAAELRYGCPVGNLAGEIATQCPALLDEAKRSLDLYRKSFATAIRRGQKSGMVRADVDADALGEVAMMLVQGAFLAAKSSGTNDAHEMSMATLRHLVLGQGSVRMITGRSALAS